VVVASHPGTELLERGAERERLTSLLEGARSGDGRLAVLEGAAGVGKTRLLQSACEIAREGSMSVLRARGIELERDHALGVVGQLFEPAVSRAEPTQRDELLAGAAALAAPVLAGRTRDGEQLGLDPSTPLLHGLYWLAVNLAERSPLLVVVDDAHWSDSASLRFLSYLVNRLEGLPILVAVAVRTGEEAADAALIEHLRSHPLAERILPQPLSTQATGVFIARATAVEPEREFVDACHRATGGNPFLLGELARELAEDRIAPIAAEATQVSELGPETVARAVLVRLNRISGTAAPLARALAILGDGAPIAEVIELAGVAEEAALAAVAAMTRAGIIDDRQPLSFAHPVLRAAIYGELTAAEAADGHRRTATLLLQRGERPERIALHLTKCEPAGDPAAAAALHAAGLEAVARGAPEVGAAYLRRALAECSETSPRLLEDLGHAELRAGDAAAAAEHLEAVFGRSAGSADRIRIAPVLARAFWLTGRTERAFELLDEIAAAAGDERELVLTFQSELMVLGFSDWSLMARSMEWLEGLGNDLPGETRGERAILGCLSQSRSSRADPAALAVDLAKRALADGQLLDDLTSDSQQYYFPIITLIAAGELAEAERHLMPALEDARRRGSALGFVGASFFLGAVAVRRGPLDEAASLGRVAMDVAALHDWLYVKTLGQGLHVQACIDQGRLDDAERELQASGGAAEIPDMAIAIYLLQARGRLRLAQGRPAEGLEDLLEVGRRIGNVPERPNPATTPWQLYASLAYTANGQLAEAGQLAGEALAIARRYQAPWLIGAALRACALAEEGSRRIELLEQAVAELSRSEVRVEHARALGDLGAALRRAGARRQAREPLRAALDIAHRAGARAIAERAREELAATGARPRRLVLTGADALTPSERRVARLAADGRTNKEIAQQLFLTEKTIEMHLAGAYRKLGIHSRRELPAKLQGSSP
jgi:DNA-binding CsgD family transcriptional regulator